MQDYLVWTHSNKVKHSCVLDQLIGVKKIFELREGVPRASTFPADAHFTMSADFPNNTVLIDSLINTDMVIVASRRLRDFCESRNLKCLEYLPVKIMDHKGKPVANEYFILNPIQPVDCLDIERSEVEWDELVKGDIDTVGQVVLDPARIDPDRELFRLCKYFEPILVHRALAEAIDREKFTGMRWIELDKYPEL
jgi:hypothetical protein